MGTDKASARSLCLESEDSKINIKEIMLSEVPRPGRELRKAGLYCENVLFVHCCIAARRLQLRVLLFVINS